MLKLPGTGVAEIQGTEVLRVNQQNDWLGFAATVPEEDAAGTSAEGGENANAQVREFWKTVKFVVVLPIVTDSVPCLALPPFAAKEMVSPVEVVPEVAGEIVNQLGPEAVHGQLPLMLMLTKALGVPSALTKKIREDPPPVAVPEH